MKIRNKHYYIILIIILIIFIYYIYNNYETFVNAQIERAAARVAAAEQRERPVGAQVAAQEVYPNAGQGNQDAILKDTYDKHKRNMEIDGEKSNLSYSRIKTDTMNIKGKIENSMINLDPNSTDKNINIGNDIIIKKQFKISGYPYNIDIPFLRYLKYLPVYFEKEICLLDINGSDCINKKHVEIVKGERKINLKTYPQNYRKCLGTKDIIHKKSLYSGPEGNLVFADNECKNGNTQNEFLFYREPHSHNQEAHYHQHAIDEVETHDII